MDRREYHLILSEKYYNYNGLMQSYIKTVMQRIRDRLSPEEAETFSRILGIISDELMPECDL